MSKRENVLLSGRYANGVLRPEAGVGELPLALQQEDLGEDGDGDFARRLVPQAQSDGRVQARVFPRVAPEPLRDAAEDGRHLAAAADETDVPRVGTDRGLQ